MALSVAGSFRRIVWPLAIAETIVWAAMYYSFPALLLEWEKDFGWSKTELTGAFTVSLLVSAAATPFAGRVIDNGHGRKLLVGSTLFGAACLFLLSQVTVLWEFYAVWILLGLAMSGCLYDACFAVLTRTMGEASKRSITLVTLVAGFAGTVSFPSANALAASIGWRGAVMVFAAAMVIVSAPLFWSSAGRAHGNPQARLHEVGRKAEAIMRIIRAPLFWCLCVCFVALALNHGMLINHLLPLLDERHIQHETAVLAASMIGPMQVMGRLAMMASERHVSTTGLFIVCTLALATASFLLYESILVPALLVGFVIFQGAGNGFVSILRPVIIAEYLGRKDFGLVAGVLASAYLIGFAFAPIVGSIIWEIGNYDKVIEFSYAMAALAFFSLIVARFYTKKNIPPV